MNRIIKALGLLFLLFFSIHLLNNKIFSFPPIGKLLDPFHGYAHSYRMADKEINLSILKEPVEIIWDENNIPHLFANNEHDLYIAQGYIVAQDRLWQMDFISRVYAGRLSEIIGYNPDILTSDRFMRTIGIVESAKASLSIIAHCELDGEINYNWDGMKESCSNGKIIVHDDMQEVYNMLVAYATGVNKYIQSMAWDEYPIEYKILDYSPELWSPLKTCILLKSMTLTLTGRNTDIVYEFIEDKYSKQDAEDLFPEFPYFTDPIITNIDSTIFNEYNSEICSDNTTNGINIEDDFYSLISNLNTMHNPGIGSNNWAVHKNYTKSGNAILANDPHLGLSLPNVWYVMQLSTPDLDIMGATFPGAPSILSGFNNYIAWGETNGEDDVSDFYKIKIVGDNKYIYDQDTLDFELRQETIFIRGNALQFPSDTTFTVKSTKHGPIIVESNNDKLSAHSTLRGIETKKNYAFRWTAHDPSQEIKAFYKLNYSKNYPDFLEALSYYDCPGQNFIYADIDGNIGMYHRGKTPIRCGKGVLPGDSSEYLWEYNDTSKFIPDRHLPKILNPDIGYVSSANQYPVNEDYPYYLAGKYWPAYRGSRINDELKIFIDKEDGVTVEDMISIQNDSYNKFAKIILPDLLKSIKDSVLNHSNQDLLIIYDSLKVWGDNPFHLENRFEPLIFDEWIDNINQAVWKDEFSDSDLADITNSRIYPFDDVLAYFIKNDIRDDSYQSKWFDDITTSDIKEDVYFIIWTAFLKTIESLQSEPNLMNKHFSDWEYSDLKGVDIRHLIGSDSFNAFSSLDVAVSGSKWSPNAMKVKYGPSWRYIVDLQADSIHAIGIYPGGQSGNPGSEYYDNYINDWADGNYLDLNFTPYNKKSDLALKGNKKVIFKND
tara:strand:+ start:2942 stop:5599 length:2658 start_codon:yes stop_codon:yes gene_type:complete